MSLFTWLRNIGRETATPQTETPKALGINDPVFREALAAAQGGLVNSDAQCNSAINRCVSLIANGIGTMPLHLFFGSRDSDNEYRKAVDHPIYTLLKTRPAAHLTAYRFRRLMQMRAMIDGNAYAFPITVGNKLIELQPIPKSRVRTEQEDDFTVIHILKNKAGQERRLAVDELFHLMGPSEDGITGKSVTSYAKDAVKASRSLDQSVVAMLQNQAQPGGFLSTDGELSEEAAQRLKQQWQDNYGGPENAGKWIVAENGLKAVPLNGSAKDAQAVELRSQQIEEIARFFGVPRPLLMLDDTSWGSGIEQLGLFFITYALLPWMIEWEQAVSLYLLKGADRDKYYAKLNERALLRGSAKDQAEIIAKAMGAGGTQPLFTLNEGRAIMEYPPVDGGDKVPTRLGE
jgi:HK97 family phage portal protein